MTRTDFSNLKGKSQAIIDVLELVSFELSGGNQEKVRSRLEWVATKADEISAKARRLADTTDAAAVLEAMRRS